MQLPLHLNLNLLTYYYIYIMLKIVILGESGTGKTSIIRQFIHSTFDAESRPTIGANFFSKSIMLSNSEITLQFWDTTGHEMLKSSFDIYLKNASGALLVDDCANVGAPSRVQEWREILLQKTQLVTGMPIPVVLLYNKCDCCEVDCQRME